MAIITPVGNKEFNWSPKEKAITKAASTGTQEAQNTDKDLLFAAAKDYLKTKKAQIEEIAVGVDGSDAGLGAGVGVDAGAEVGVGGAEVVDKVCEPCQEATTKVGEIGKTEVGADAQKAVTELVDKANKAQEVVEKVQQAVDKVEQAVAEVKDAVGAELAEGIDEVPEEVEIEITDDEEPNEGDTEVVEDADAEVEVTEDEAGEGEGEGEGDKDDEDDKDEGFGKKEDEIVQESREASNKKLQMKSAGDADGMVRIAKLSPSVKKRVYDYWKNQLGYVPDFCKLLVQDN